MQIKNWIKCHILNKHYANITGMFETEKEVNEFFRAVKYYTMRCDRCHKRVVVDFQNPIRTDIYYDSEA